MLILLGIILIIVGISNMASSRNNPKQFFTGLLVMMIGGLFMGAMA